MSIYSKIRDSLNNRKMAKLREQSDFIVQEISQQFNNSKMTYNSEAERSVSNLSSRVVQFNPIKKKKSSRDRELMMNGVYLNRYNLGDLYAAYTRETYIKASVDKYVEGIVQRGYHYGSKLQKAVDYIRKRVKEFSLVSSKGTRAIIRDLTFSLVLFGNAFLIKVRDEDKSSGLAHKWNGRVVKPIAGWYVADPRRIVIHEKDNGSVEYWIMKPKVKSVKATTDKAVEFLKNIPGYLFSWAGVPFYGGFSQSTGDNSDITAKLKSEDVEHIRYHHTPGEKWSMPPFYPVLDDINLLRSIETAVDLLIYQFGSLLIHVKVSNPSMAAAINDAIRRPAKQADIEDARRTLTNMESNGFIVTGDHVEMEVLQIAGNILQLEEYLRYFKERVFSGLWLSPVMVGETGDSGAARSVADTIVDEKMGKIIELQSILASSFEMIFFELLLEAGLSASQSQRRNVAVELVFDDVDIELELKKRESTLSLYQSGLLTESESRRTLGKDELTEEEREETYPRLVKGYLVELEQKAKMGLLEGMTPEANSASNKVVPENQSGKKQNTKKPVNK